MKTNTTKTAYRFQTIVATEAVRAEFTAKREALETTDKQLMSALWNLGERFAEELEAELLSVKNDTDAEREAKKIARKEKKEAEKAAELLKAAKRAEKNAKRREQRAAKKEVVTIVEGEEGEPEALVVDGTEG